MVFIIQQLRLWPGVEAEVEILHVDLGLHAAVVRHSARRRSYLLLLHLLQSFPLLHLLVQGGEGLRGELQHRARHGLGDRGQEPAEDRDCRQRRLGSIYLHPFTRGCPWWRPPDCRTPGGSRSSLVCDNFDIEINIHNILRSRLYLRLRQRAYTALIKKVLVRTKKLLWILWKQCI